MAQCSTAVAQKLSPRALPPPGRQRRTPTNGARASAPRRSAFPMRQLMAAALSRRELLGSGAAAAALLPAAGASVSQGVAASAASAAEAAPEAAAAGAAAAGPAVEIRELRLERDANGVERVAFQPEGYNTWHWRGHKVNWMSAGDSGPVVLLIHGFGAHVWHWRYNVPELAKHCRVYALDVLGFGWSSKALVDYNGYGLWTDQISDFIREVVGGEKAVLVGNSLGGYNALATAAKHQDLVRGVVLLNAAGRFEEPDAAAAGEEAALAQPAPSLWANLVDQVSTAVKRAVVFASFVFTKQPARIKQVLSQVYVDKTNIDDDLVRSISLPAQDPNAPEVFYRIITARGEPMNKLLDKLEGRMPLYLLWGDKDPWCVPARATQIQRYYPSAERTDLDSGHCPHDDSPAEVNRELLRWLGKLPPLQA